MGGRFVVMGSVLMAMYLPHCAAAVRPTMMPWNAPLASLWQQPADLSERDLFNGPWGVGRAPRADAVYTLIERKHHGVNPGMTVRGADGRKWSVKQAPTDGQFSEAPIE